jgi:predicted DNA-binding protein
MKATIDLPDDLYQRMVAESERQGRPVDAVVSEFLRRSLDEVPGASHAAEAPHVAARPPGMTRREWAKQQPTPKWLDDWFRAADEAFKDAPPGPTAREILEEDRNRLER